MSFVLKLNSSSNLLYTTKIHTISTINQIMECVSFVTKKKLNIQNSDYSPLKF